jgi:hypothetical protein
MALTDINGTGVELSVTGSSGHSLTDINSRSVNNSIAFRFARGNVGTLTDIDQQTGCNSGQQTIKVPRFFTYPKTRIVNQ